MSDTFLGDELVLLALSLLCGMAVQPVRHLGSSGGCFAA